MSWETYRLGDILTLKRGHDLPSSIRQDGDVPVVSSSGITGWHNEYKSIAPGIVTGRYGTLGEVFFINENYWPLNTALYVTDFKGSNPRFLYYLLKFLLRNQQSDKAAVPGVNRNVLHELKVKFTSNLVVQELTAEILNTYDDLIENNTRQIQLLEEAARQFYKEWFVRLRFPGHEQVKLADGVPEGWERTTIDKVCSSIEDGDWIESKDQGGNDYRLLQISNIGINEFVETGNFRYITEGTFKRLRCREILPGYILIARMPKPIGRAWLVTELPWKMITAVDVAILVPDASVADPYFLLHHLNSQGNINLCERRAVGATRPRITRKNISSLPVLLPPSNLQQAFRDLTEPLNQQRILLFRQNNKLQEARDLLLPRLMSGEIRV